MNEDRHRDETADTDRGPTDGSDSTDTWHWHALPPCIPMSGFAFDSVLEELEALDTASR